MSEIITKLATIEISDEALRQLDLGDIYSSFSSNYLKLDNLKNFRSEHEKKNWLMRFWHSDKLANAQLDSAEVQAEFSKTIGQLMMISIMQSKKLYEQQTQLNEQQGKLKAQADGIAKHAGELQKQHQILAEQSTRLETLVHEYFALKGLTEEGAQKLIEIAREVKTTKDVMLQEFAARSKNLETLCAALTSQMTSLATQVNNQIHLSSGETQSAIASLRQETHEALNSTESILRNRQDAAQQTINQCMTTLEQRQRESEVSLLAKNGLLESALSDVSTKLGDQEAAHREELRLIAAELGSQAARSSDVSNELSRTKAEVATSIQELKNLKNIFIKFQHTALRHIKRMNHVAVGLTVTALGLIGVIGATYLG